jgi:hypothetical protein
MADTDTDNQEKNFFIEDIDPTTILIKEYLIKYIYCSNRFKEYNTKLEILLERIKNSTIKLLVESMFYKMKILLDELKDIQYNDSLLIKYINKISELYKITTDFDNILLFYSYQ